jgi:hypothetical protein
MGLYSLDCSRRHPDRRQPTARITAKLERAARALSAIGETMKIYYLDAARTKVILGEGESSACTYRTFALARKALIEYNRIWMKQYLNFAKQHENILRGALRQKRAIIV